MVKKTYWLTIYLMLFGIVISFVIQGLLGTSFSLRFSTTISILVSIVFVSIVLIFVFEPLKKNVTHLSIFQEKYKEAKNLFEKADRDLEEKNKMLRQKTEMLTTFNRISKAMVSTFDLDKILDLVIEAVQKEMNFDGVIVFLLEKHKLVPGKCVGIWDDKHIGQSLEKLSIPLIDKSNFIVQTVIEGRSRICQQMDERSLTDRFTKLYKDVQPDLLAVIPLISKEKVTGVLLIDNTVSQKKIEERDIRAISVFINQAGLAIDNARLFELEKSFTEELKRQIEIAKKELEQAQAALIKQERLAAMGQMSAIVAHEIRNPMTSIRVCTQRLQKKTTNDEQSKKYTNYIINEIDRLEQIVKNLLMLSKEPVPQFQSTDVNVLIEEVLYFLKPEITLVGAHLVKSLKSSMSLINIDSALIRQVLLNMIQNALFFISDKEKKELKITTLTNDSNFAIEISDTGPGIPKENIEKIFEPFFTTRPSGVGLGLSICHKIVEAHKGKIMIESEVGCGTTFRVMLPI